MGTLLQKVKTLLRKSLPKSQVPWLEGDGDGIVGIVVSSRFRGMEDIDRVRFVHKVLDSGLRPEERQKIALIVPMTPGDYKGYRETHAK